MKLSELRETIQSRELKVGEVLSGTLLLLEQRFKRYFILAVLVFLPSSLITELFLSTLPAELGLNDTMRLYILQLMLNMYTMISLCVTAIMVQNQLETDEDESFGTSLYRGIRNWPRFLITMVLVLVTIGAGLSALLMIGMMMPILMVPAMAFIVILTVIGVVLIYDVCTAATLRRYMLVRCINYVRSILKDHLGKSIGVILLLSLISSLIALPVVSLVNTLMVILNNPVLTIVVNTLVGALTGIVNIFTNIGAVLFFMNLELMKFKELGAIE